MEAIQQWTKACLDRLDEWGLGWSGVADAKADWAGGEILLDGGEQAWEFRTLLSRQLRPSTVEHRLTTLIHESSDQVGDAPWLLFTERITMPVAEKLRERGICYMDTAGNAWLRRPGLLVSVEGRRPVDISTATPRTPSSRAALQLTFLLLKGAEWLRKPYRKLAESSGLALSTVGGVMAGLIKAGDVRRLGGRLAYRSPDELHSDWERRWHETLRPSLGGVLYRGKPDPGFKHLLDVCSSEAGWLVGGELAAAMTLGEVEPISATIHVPSDEVRACRKKLKLLPHPEGNIRLLETFGSQNEWRVEEPQSPARATHVLADPILIRAELLESSDARLHRLANSLLADCIQPRWEI